MGRAGQRFAWRRGMTSTRLGALLTLVLVMTGCPSFNTRGSVRTLDPGQTEVVTAISVVNYNLLRGQGVFDEEDFIPKDRGGNLQVGLGYGLTEGLELGGRMMFGDVDFLDLLPAVAVDAKFQLARADDSGAGLDIAVDPTFTVGWLDDDRRKKILTYAQLPVMMGLNLSPYHQFQLNPQVTWLLPHEVVRSERFIPSLGLAYVRRTEEGWGLKPEVIVLVPADVEGRRFSRFTVMFSFSVLSGPPLTPQG